MQLKLTKNITPIKNYISNFVQGAPNHHLHHNALEDQITDANSPAASANFYSPDKSKPVEESIVLSPGAEKESREVLVSPI